MVHMNLEIAADWEIRNYMKEQASEIEFQAKRIARLTYEGDVGQVLVNLMTAYAATDPQTYARLMSDYLLKNTDSEKCQAEVMSCRGRISTCVEGIITARKILITRFAR